MDNKKKISLDDIFGDDEFGILDSKLSTSSVKSEEDRLIDAFEEINDFVNKNNREPGSSSMSEYSLLAKLKAFRQDEANKKILKPFDKHNLLGHVEIEKVTLDDILNEDDDLINPHEELSIFKYKNIPKEEERAEADFVAQRKSLKEKNFKKYEELFHKVHLELKDGKRKLLPFVNIEKNLHIGDFYLLDGIMLYLESADLEQSQRELNSGNRVRVDGRTKTVFENGTYSNMLYRSLGKQIQKSGKMITNTDEFIESELFVNSNLLQEEDVLTGWIYVLKSKSTNKNLVSLTNLYKIGFSKFPIEERIKNAKNEATFLYGDVIKVASYKCYNRNADKLELLLHRFFASACLDIDVEIIKGKRINPREWFIVPFEVIEIAIQLILDEKIIDYRYDHQLKSIVLK